MNRHRALFAIALAWTLSQAPLSAAGDRSRLVGVWRFVHEADTKADGFMSVTLMPTGR
jgi:hypothetical protein